MVQIISNLKKIGFHCFFACLFSTPVLFLYTYILQYLIIAPPLIFVLIQDCLHTQVALPALKKLSLIKISIEANVEGQPKNGQMFIGSYHGGVLVLDAVLRKIRGH